MRRSLSLALAALTLTGCGHAVVTATKPGGSVMSAAALSDVLVKPRPGAALALGDIGRVVRAAPLGWLVVHPTGDAATALSRLRQAPWVAAVEPMQQVRHPKATQRRTMRQGLFPTFSTALYNDPDYAKGQIAYHWVRSEEAWKITTGTPQQIVAVLDTGIDAGHPDLKNRLVPGYDAMHDKPDPRDDNAHGTACAGIIAAEANNAIGVVGVAPDVRVMPIKVLDSLGNGPLEVAAKGLVWAADHGARIATMSFGEDAPSQLLEDAIAYARSKDMVLIASMGNDGEEVKHWPAASPGVLAVGATYAEDDTPTMFTTLGDHVGIAAPGDEVWTTMPTYPTPNPIVVQERNYDWFGGTSASGPIVGAIAALVRTRFPQLTESQVRARLRATADDVGPKGWDNLTGDGRVNALTALTAPL